MSLTEDKERVLKILKDRKSISLNRLRVTSILNKNAKVDVDDALSSLAADSKVKKDSQNTFFSATTTTSTSTTTTTV